MVTDGKDLADSVKDLEGRMRRSNRVDAPDIFLY